MPSSARRRAVRRPPKMTGCRRRAAATSGSGIRSRGGATRTRARGRLHEAIRGRTGVGPGAHGLFAPAASATHSWGSFHWARSSNPFALGLDNNLTTPEWQAIAKESSSKWSESAVIDTPLSEPRSDNKRCKPTSGRVEVCNGRYGSTGWLGLAQVWTSGGHVVQCTVKMKDTYLAGSGYTRVNRKHVLCQEVGHTFGLGHQDESGKDLGICMDYASALDNENPNGHDGNSSGSSTAATQTRPIRRPLRRPPRRPAATSGASTTTSTSRTSETAASATCGSSGSSAASRTTPRRSADQRLTAGGRGGARHATDS